MPDLPPFPTMALRLLLIGGGLGAWFVTQRLIGSRTAGARGIADQLHRLTRRANEWLHRHPRAADALLIGSSLGAEVGLSLAANYPQRVTALVCDGAFYSEGGPYGKWDGSEEAFK